MRCVFVQILGPDRIGGATDKTGQTQRLQLTKQTVSPHSTNGANGSHARVGTPGAICAERAPDHAPVDGDRLRRGPIRGIPWMICCRVDRGQFWPRMALRYSSSVRAWRRSLLMPSNRRVKRSQRSLPPRSGGESGPYVGADPAVVGAVGVDAPGDAFADREGHREESVLHLVGFPGDGGSRVEVGDGADPCARNAGDLLPDPEPGPDSHVVAGVEAFDAVVFGVGRWPPGVDVDQRVPHGGGGCVDADGFGEIECRLFRGADPGSGVRDHRLGLRSSQRRVRCW